MEKGEHVSVCKSECKDGGRGRTMGYRLHELKSNVRVAGDLKYNARERDQECRRIKWR